MVPDRFDEPWQLRHQVLTRLSPYFHVVWVGPTREWREILAGRPAVGARDLREFSRGWTHAFVAYTPPAWLPLLHRPAWLAQLLERIRLRRARRILVKRGCRKIVVSLWRPAYERALTVVPHNLATYHVDDEYTFSNEAAPDQRELRLIEVVDVVSVHSVGLMRLKGHLNPRTIFVPNGVDYAAYATEAPEPADLAQIPHPRIGYTGYLKSQLDWPLLSDLIRSHSEWNFVFVGPRRDHAEVAAIVPVLAREPNVHFLGWKSQDELSAYPQHFDVCVMPYRANNYTNCIYPLKLHEYLASGRPVVGTRISTLEEFADVVSLASTPAEWSVAIAAALDPAAQAEPDRSARQAVARRHDWSAIARRMARLIASGLGLELLDADCQRADATVAEDGSQKLDEVPGELFRQRFPFVS
jgi:glycosyltransferase involved in cell wall biosynthesis